MNINLEVVSDSVLQVHAKAAVNNGNALKLQAVRNEIDRRRKAAFQVVSKMKSLDRQINKLTTAH